MTPDELSDRLIDFGVPDHRLADLLDECSQLCNILAKSLITAKAGRNPRRR